MWRSGWHKLLHRVNLEEHCPVWDPQWIRHEPRRGGRLHATVLGPVDALAKIVPGLLSASTWLGSNHFIFSRSIYCSLGMTTLKRSHVCTCSTTWAPISSAPMDPTATAPCSLCPFWIVTTIGTNRIWLTRTNTYIRSSCPPTREEAIKLYQACADELQRRFMVNLPLFMAKIVSKDGVEELPIIKANAFAK